MVTLSLTPKQARLLSLHATPVEDVYRSIDTTTQPTIAFTVDPVVLEGLRYTAILRASPILQMQDYLTWKELVYVITDAMVAHSMGIPARKVA